jgi:hypothetical protein
VYWFHFVFDGWHYQQSTNKGNKNVARQIESSVRSDLAKGQSRDHKETPRAHVGRVQAPRDRKIVKLHAADHPRTVEFYEQTFKRVLSFEPLAKANLRDIDEELIARFSSGQMGIVQTATIKRALSGDSGVPCTWPKNGS